MHRFSRRQPSGKQFSLGMHRLRKESGGSDTSLSKPEPVRGQSPQPEDVTYSVPLTDVKDIQKHMTDHVAIVRTEDELTKVKEWLERVPFQIVNVKEITKEQLELAHLWQTAKQMTVSALLRTESRGGHYRSDCPAPDDKTGMASKSFTQKAGSRSDKTKGL